MMQDRGIPSRKESHVDLSMREDVAHAGSNGFEHWKFEHTALPELDFLDVDTGAVFLGKPLSFPLIVTGMTGGYPRAEEINGELAAVCNAARVALGVGSQRQALADSRSIGSWAVARRNAPDVPVVANIGAAEVASMRDADNARRLVDMIEADALAVHCNPLQEFLQPEGNPEFRGALRGIGMLVRDLPVPVIVKEVGAGISAGVAQRLFDVGVRWVDVAGTGGTSWAGIEMLRRDDSALEVSPAFREWGIPAAVALVAVARIKPPDAHLIGSGGISDGVMIAKCLALGADLAGAARPILKRLLDEGPDALLRLLHSWKNDLQGVMFLTGASTIRDLQRTPMVRSS